jgi:hypothetical protein
MSSREFFILLAMTAFVVTAACNKPATSDSSSTQGRPPETFADAQSAANASLALFRQLVNNQNFRDLGFESTDEVASATLGESVPVVFVRRDQLREYREGTDLNIILSQSNQRTFPVLAKDQVRSSVVVEQVNGRWKMGTLGNGALAKQIAAARQGQAPGGTNQQALVHFGALGLYFLGERTENKWTLKALAPIPDLKLAAGSALPAEEVFMRLSGIAKNLRDDAPM